MKFLFTIFCLVLFSCSSCNKESQPIDSANNNDYDCPTAPDGVCQFESTTFCKDGSVYSCIHVKDSNNCIVEHRTSLQKRCDTCETITTPDNNNPGKAVCITPDYDTIDDVNDLDETTDIDIDSGETCPYEDSDAEYIEINRHSNDEPCPKLSAAKFPYYDSDGTIHFCRQCDKIRKDDPQCVRNLWRDANNITVKDHPEFDCCLFPCEMNNLQSRLYDKDDIYEKMDVCDLIINPKDVNTGMGWSAGSIRERSVYLDNGKIALFAAPAGGYGGELEKYATITKSFVYDIKSKSYRAMSGQTFDSMVYYNGAFLWNIDDSTRGINHEYIVYYNPERGYSVVYPNMIVDIVYSAAMNDKWIFAVINEPDEKYMLKYAKIGEWKWTMLTNSVGSAAEPQIVDNRLVFYTRKFESYVCDLDKAPQDLSDCLKLNREGEEIRTTIFDDENSNYVYYENPNIMDKIFKRDLTKESAEVEIFPVNNVHPGTIGNSLQKIKGDLLLYNNVFFIKPDDDKKDSRSCFYRFSEKKSYCADPDIYYDTDGKPRDVKYLQGASQFDGYHLVWQGYNRHTIKYRDMKCYCKSHPESCPFPELRVVKDVLSLNRSR